jgi:hypothetical protein
MQKNVITYIYYILWALCYIKEHKFSILHGLDVIISALNPIKYIIFQKKRL